MLNLLGMLKADVTPLKDRTPSKDKTTRVGNYGMTLEQKEKRAKTMRERRNQRWKEAFDKFDGVATCAQLATVTDYTPASINAVLSKMRMEVPTVVVVVGQAERSGPLAMGRKPLIYKWIGE